MKTSKELKELLERATKGPWKRTDGDPGEFYHILGPVKSNATVAILPQRCFVNAEESDGNSLLIALAPSLAAEVLRTREFAEHIALYKNCDTRNLGGEDARTFIDLALKYLAETDN